MGSAHEGAKRETAPDYARLLNIAEGSLSETEYLLLLSRDLGYILPKIYEPLQREASEIARMLFALRTKVARTTVHEIRTVDCQLSTRGCAARGHAHVSWV